MSDSAHPDLDAWLDQRIRQIVRRTLAGRIPGSIRAPRSQVISPDSPDVAARCARMLNSQVGRVILVQTAEGWMGSLADGRCSVVYPGAGQGQIGPYYDLDALLARLEAAAQRLAAGKGE